jgi:hypothetical protein
MHRAKILSIFIFGLVIFFSIHAFCENFSEVERSFERFKKAWIKKLDRIEKENLRNIRIGNSGDLFRAEYIGYGKKFNHAIKKTQSSFTPFIGILTYYEIKYVSIGRDKKRVLKGPFTIEMRTKVKEIFRYTRGKWFY